MSAPGQTRPPSKRAGGVASLVALVLLPLLVVVCGGICAAGLFLLAFQGESFAQRAERALQQVRAAAPMPSPPRPSPPVQPGVNDWMTQRMLAPVYTTALDAVAAHPQVIERLGEPVETRTDADELFRLKDANQADPDASTKGGPRTIEFDVLGPKGAAVVTVVAATDDKGPGYAAFRATEIVVKFSDGSTVAVDPPKEQRGREIR